MSMPDNAVDAAVSAAERLESYESAEQVEPLEVLIETTLGGSLQSITLVTSLGGPTIRVNLYQSTVTAVWGTESHTTHWDNDDLQSELISEYEAKADGREIHV